MADIRFWEPTAAGNDKGAPPDYMPEMQVYADSVTDHAREQQAALRRWYEVAQWVWGFPSDTVTVTYVAVDQFRLSGDQTAEYHVGRRVKVIGATTNVEGVIAAAPFSAGNTDVTVLLPAGGAISNEALTVHVGESVLSPGGIPATFDDSGASVLAATNGATYYRTATATALFQVKAARLTNGNGAGVVLPGGAGLTLDMNVDGANGRDGSALVAGWWYVHCALHKHTGVGVLQATPNLPGNLWFDNANVPHADHPYSGLLGAVYWTGTEIRDFLQVGRHVSQTPFTLVNLQASASYVDANLGVACPVNVQEARGGLTVRDSGGAGGIRNGFVADATNGRGEKVYGGTLVASGDDNEEWSSVVNPITHAISWKTSTNAQLTLTVSHFIW